MPGLLVANGCSYTQGAELTDAAREAWPAVLADLLGLTCVNLGLGGTSNRRMVRSTVLALQQLRAETKVAPADTLVMLAWTDISRHEYYSDIEEAPKAVEAVDRYGTEDNWHRIGQWRRKHRHKPTRAFYDHLWSQEGQWINLALDWLLLDRFLSAEGYSARYAFVAVPPPLPPMATTLVAPLGADRAWGGVPPAADNTFEGLATKVPRGPRGHPLAEGHDAFARALAGWIEGTRPPAGGAR